jgi:hypothetical protein
MKLEARQQPIDRRRVQAGRMDLLQWWRPPPAPPARAGLRKRQCASQASGRHARQGLLAGEAQIHAGNPGRPARQAPAGPEQAAGVVAQPEPEAGAEPVNLRERQLVDSD